MSKITITPLRQQTGVYGTVRAHQPVELDADLAKDLLKSGLWVKGLTDEAKRFQESVKQRRADEAAKAAEKAKADAEAEAAAQAAADAEAKAQAEADAKAKAEAEAAAKADADKKAAK